MFKYKRDLERDCVMTSRVKPGLIVREVAGCPVVIGVGEAASWFSGMVRLNETSLVVWRGLEEGMSNEEIADRLCGTFDIERDVALRDVDVVVSRLSAADLLA